MPRTGEEPPFHLHPFLRGLVLLVPHWWPRVKGVLGISQPHVTLPNGYHIIIVFPEAGSPLT